MPSPRPRSLSLRGACAATVGRLGRWGANGFSATSTGPSRNGFGGRAAWAGANGLAEAVGDGANGFDSRFGGANGLPADPPEPTPAAREPASEPEPAGSQPGRPAFEPRSA